MQATSNSERLLEKFMASMPEAQERMARLGSCEYCQEGLNRAQFTLNAKIEKIREHGDKWGNFDYLMSDREFTAQMVYARTMASHALSRPMGTVRCTCAGA